MKRPAGRIRVGIHRQVGTMRSPSSTLMSRHLRIFWADLPGFVFVHVGGCVGVPAMSSAGQFAHRAGANHHGIKVLSHTERLGVQRVARVIQQVQDASVSNVYLPA